MVFTRVPIVGQRVVFARVVTDDAPHLMFVRKPRPARKLRGMVRLEEWVPGGIGRDDLDFRGRGAAAVEIRRDHS